MSEEEFEDEVSDIKQANQIIRELKQVIHASGIIGLSKASDVMADSKKVILDPVKLGQGQLFAIIRSGKKLELEISMKEVVSIKPLNN